jgi:tRNA (cytidine/uridine-2'-O-)-methyltransferase
MPEPLLNIVLLHPQIPNNTGNAGRTAAVTGCRLHIVHPIAFDMSEKARRRAGLDYWHLVAVPSGRPPAVRQRDRRRPSVGP